MFTGLIEALGTVQEVAPSPAGWRLRVDATLAPELTPGESIAVNGVCLTAVSPDRAGFFADVSPETARVTTIAALTRGTIVNLERPLKPESRLGGHFVQGHVDGTGTIEELRPQGDSYWLSVAFPRTLAPYIVHKGSIAIDGISLTVAQLGERVLGVQIVPFTWDHTNLHAARPRDPVNIECDILGKYVARIAELGWRETTEGAL